MHDARPVAVVLGQAQNNPLLILGAEDVVQRVVDLETALRVRVAVLGGNHARSKRVDASMLQSAGDVVALAGLLAALECGKDASNQEHGALVIAVAVGRDHGGVALVNRGAENAAAAHVAGNVKAGSVLFGALLAIAKAVAHDQARELLVQGFPVEAHLGQRLGAGVGDEDVSFREELHHDLEALFGLEVQSDEALVEVGHVEREVLFVAGGHAENDSLVDAAGIALERLNLDDIGTPFAEDAARGRGRKEGGEVNDFKTLEWLHAFLLVEICNIRFPGSMVRELRTHFVAISQKRKGGHPPKADDPPFMSEFVLVRSTPSKG